MKCSDLLWKLRLLAAKVARLILWLIGVGPKILGPFLVLLALVLIFGFTAECLYVQWKLHYRKPWYLLALGMHVFINVVVSYWRLIRSDPSYGPLLSPEVPDEAETHITADGLIVPVCKKCVPRRLKIPRSHHCKSCGVCVLRMDHHCPWVNSCIGEGNYHLFISFLQWCLIGLLYCAAWMAKPWAAYVMGTSATVRELGEYEEYMITLVFVLSAALSGAVLLLLASHVYFICNDLTTLEFQFSPEPYLLSPTIADTLWKTQMWTFPRFLWAASSAIDVSEYVWQSSTYFQRDVV